MSKDLAFGRVGPEVGSLLGGPTLNRLRRWLHQRNFYLYCIPMAALHQPIWVQSNIKYANFKVYNSKNPYIDAASAEIP